LAGAKKNPQNAAPNVQMMLGHLAVNAIVAQWVPQVDEKAAEDSFFKINQAATPIDRKRQAEAVQALKFHGMSWSI
jgi:hypothetical protein